MEEELYNICFTDGRVNNCGREKCMALIMELQKKYPGVDFGNEQTGFMNVENIVKYMEKN